MIVRAWARRASANLQSCTSARGPLAPGAWAAWGPGPPPAGQRGVGVVLRSTNEESADPGKPTAGAERVYLRGFVPRALCLCVTCEPDRVSSHARAFTFIEMCASPAFKAYPSRAYVAFVPVIQ